MNTNTAPKTDAIVACPAMGLTYERRSPSRVMVRRDGEFLLWLTKSTRTQQQGLHNMRVTRWEGTVLGAEVTGWTLEHALEKLKVSLALNGGGR